MSEKEKQNATSILTVLNKLSEVKGAAFTEGLIAGILLATANPGDAQMQSCLCTDSIPAGM